MAELVSKNVDTKFSNQICLLEDYCTRATISRSRLVAAPLRFQAKKHFLFAFYVVI